MPRSAQSIWIERRSRLLAPLPDRTVLIANGGVRHRNTTAVEYPFRGSSHFMFLAGRQPAGALLLLRPGRSVLAVDPLPADYALWNGAAPDPGELAERAGVDAVISREELRRELAAVPPESVLTIATDDPLANRELEALTGRAIDHAGHDAPLLQAIVACRLRQDAFATAEMREAIDVTARAHAAARSGIRAGALERTIRAEIEREILAAGCEPAYQTICTVHGEVLHNHAYGNVLKDGDLLLVDAGAESHGGYASDVTRVYPVSGRLSPTQRAIYQLVLRAQQSAIESVKPGVRFRDLHLMACRVLIEGLIDLQMLRGEAGSLLERGAHALFFPHGLGHLIGLDVQDMRDLGDAAWYPPGRERSTQFGLSYLRLDRDLEPGMCVTIEPGLYFVPSILQSRALVEPLRDAISFDTVQRFADVRGVRIEDDVRVTASGAEVLTSAIPKAASLFE